MAAKKKPATKRKTKASKKPASKTAKVSKKKAVSQATAAQKANHTRTYSIILFALSAFLFFFRWRFWRW